MRLEEVLAEALKIVKPTQADESLLKNVIGEMENILKDEISRIDGILGISLEGSAAKNTWIRGREEADIFIHFDKNVPRDEMEKKVIEIGFRAIERAGGKPRLMYADHPYVEGVVNGVTIDIVACYDVEPLKWLSATDRTPYHTRYIIERLKPGQEDQVRLLKGFMIGCGVYGAEIKVKGFSGYLTELLILNYGDFINVIKNAANWKPPVAIDLERYYRSTKEMLEIFRNQPLIVIDPIDKSRNVASAVSLTKLSEFILASKLFISNPSLNFFKPQMEKPSVENLKRLSAERNLLHIFFKLEVERPPDVLWGELKKSEEGIRRALERLGFKVYRSGSWTDETESCLLIFELDTLKLPNFAIHKGPPVYLKTAEDFIEKWSGKAIGPWIQGDRLYVLRRRDEVDVVKLLKRELDSNRVAIAKGLASLIRNAKIDHEADGLIRSAVDNPSMLNFINSFLKAKPPFI
ncbi:MAG: CCA tRNA nucleotidyltransferase [Thaumarchaeota archaeon]|nr:MAG: CCA tRNA nucleotidyltransferase [Nitrososphaerota archaeon]